MSANTSTETQKWECGHTTPIVASLADIQLQGEPRPPLLCPNCHCNHLLGRLFNVKLTINTCRTSFQAADTAQARLRVLRAYEDVSPANSGSATFDSVSARITELEENVLVTAVDEYIDAMARFRESFLEKVLAQLVTLSEDAARLCEIGGDAELRCAMMGDAELRCAMIVHREARDMIKDFKRGTAEAEN